MRTECECVDCSTIRHRSFRRSSKFRIVAIEIFHWIWSIHRMRRCLIWPIAMHLSHCHTMPHKRGVHLKWFAITKHWYANSSTAIERTFVNVVPFHFNRLLTRSPIGPIYRNECGMKAVYLSSLGYCARRAVSWVSLCRHTSSALNQYMIS